MLKKLSVLTAAALAISACETTQPATAPPPSQPTAQSYMVFFDLDSARVSPQAQDTLRQAAAAYKSSGTSGVAATGHTDTTGSANYNLALSQRRASAVRDVLVREGVPAAAITTSGRGESQPLVQTADGVLEPQNRRTEVAAAGMAASPNDLAYCREMSRRYRQFLGARQSLPDAGEALAQCDAGNPGPAIPVLERLLTDARIPLPPRV
jgi:hypothetical protein